MEIRKPELKLNNTIGRLDRVLSEILYLCEHGEIDEVDAQTLKHHCDDLIGVGTKGLSVLKARKPYKAYNYQLSYLIKEAAKCELAISVTEDPFRAIIANAGNDNPWSLVFQSNDEVGRFLEGYKTGRDSIKSKITLSPTVITKDCLITRATKLGFRAKHIGDDIITLYRDNGELIHSFTKSDYRILNFYLEGAEESGKMK